MRKLLLVLIQLLARPSLSAADDPHDFFGPTGLPFSGYVGGVDDEIAHIRLHFDLTDEQEVALSREIARHRKALERMHSLHHTLESQHTLDQFEIAGGHEEMHARNAELGPLRYQAYNKVLDAQANLETHLAERIRKFIVPSSEVIWKDYLLTRDFERWRQPSWHESFGETIDPLLLVHRVHPKLIDDPKAEEVLRELRREAHTLASAMIIAYQRHEVDSIEVFNYVKPADHEKSSDLHERALLSSFALASFLWTVPDRLAEAGFGDFDTRRYHESFTEQQGLVSRLNGLAPIEDKIAGAIFVNNALALPNLQPEQRDRLRAMWSEMREAYDRASELDHKFNDSWIRTGGLYERPDYPDEIRTIFREAGKKPDEIASILTLPQWYELVRHNEFWGRQLYKYHPDYETFDWSTLDFEALIPE